MEQEVQNTSSNLLVRKLGMILSVFVFLLPVFFVPVSGVGLYVAKITLLATGLVAIFAIFLSSVLSTGTIELPKVKYLIPIGAFALIALLSSVFSGSISSSLAGSVFDLGTSGSIIMLVFLMFMTILAVKSIGVVSKVVTAFIYSTVALALYTLLGAFGYSLIPVSLASKMPFFLAGGAVDTAIIFGGAVILALCAINMSEVSKRMKYILYALTAFSLIFIGATNFTPVVIILGLISLVFFVYILSWSVGKPNNEGGEMANPENNTQGQNRKISLSSLTVLVVSVILLLGGSGISDFFSKTLRVQTTEIRPNFQTTMDLTLLSWKQNFALGVGPNRFSELWDMHKPVEINQTQFWGAEFYSGSGFVPTIAITTGILGLVSLLAFIVMYLLTGVKAIFAQANAGRSRYLSTASFLVSIYLWIMLFLYSPSIVLMALAFIFTGLFTATLVPQGIISLWKINIFSNPKTNFLSVLSIVVLLIVSVAGGYFVWERSAAAVIFEKSIIAYQTTGDIQSARQSIARSVTMVPSDIYWRGLTEISLNDLGRVLGSVSTPEQMTDEVRTQAQALIADSVASAKAAVAADDDNFQNWFVLARVYEVLGANGIEGSLEEARNAYNKASTLSPSNPSVPLALSRLDALDGKIEESKANIVKALELKNNYTDAYFTLAQLQVAQNDIPSAVKSVEAATLVEPTNTGLYFQLGLLKYNQKDYLGAASALERAVTLVPDYANAKYFLGLAYYKLNRKEDSLKQFEEIKATNPENTEVSLIIENMKAGKEIFSDVQAPLDEEPEKRAELPIKEEN